MTTTDFLRDPGTSGFIATPFDLLSTEMNTLANTDTCVSSVGGTSGVFSQSNTVHAVTGQIWFSAGGTFTPSTGGYILGWFLNSSDGGTTFEFTEANNPLARAADFVIPFLNTAHASSDLVWAQGIEVLLPAGSFKVFIQNGTGTALPSSGNVLVLAPTAIHYN